MTFWLRNDVRQAMKYLWIASTILIILQAYTAYSKLPVNIATHFNSSGVPDDWSSRKNFFIQWYSLTLGMNGLWLLMVILMPRSLNSKFRWAISIPNKEYWLSTDEGKIECSKLMNGMVFGLAFLTNLLFAFVCRGIVISNTQMGGKINLGQIFITAALLLIFIGVYSLTAFRKPK